MALKFLAPIVGGIAGALAGSQGQKQVTSRQLGAETELEKQGGKAALSQLQQLQALIGSQSQAQGDVDQARAMQQQFIERLQSLAQSGGLPSAQDLEFGQQMIAPQRVAMNQALQEQNIQAMRQAGQMGRTGADPIIQAKLAQLRQQGEERLGAQASQFALGNIDRTLNFQAQATQMQSGLATQALANRQALASLGSQLWGQGANFRTGNATVTQSQPGGMQGMVSGLFGGAAAGMSLFNAFGKSGNNNSTTPSGNQGFAFNSYGDATLPTATNTSAFGNTAFSGNF